MGGGLVGAAPVDCRCLALCPSVCPPSLPIPTPTPVQAFLAGLAVGQMMPTAPRRRTATQTALISALLLCGLAVLGGTALLLAGTVQAQPRAVYYT